MKITKYMVIIINCGQEFVDVINKISEDEPRQVINEGSSIITFTTPMLFGELYNLLSNVSYERGKISNGMDIDNFILTKLESEDLKTHLITGIDDFLNFEANISDFIGMSNIDLSSEHNKEHIDLIKFTSERENHSVNDILTLLTTEETETIKEEIIDKLPKISDWEKEFLKNCGDVK